MSVFLCPKKRSCPYILKQALHDPQRRLQPEGCTEFKKVASKENGGRLSRK